MPRTSHAISVAVACLLLGACTGGPPHDDARPALPSTIVAEDAPQGSSGPQPEVVFTDYSPLSGNSELIRRLLSPLTAVRIQRMLAGSGKPMREQEVNLSEERFTLHVPPREPPQGYALLVFVSPWPEAELPQGWAAVLDQYGVIFVSAARSGNDADIMARRAPLALIAANNILRRYAVDPQRVYIGGFSGGARVAQRLALDYPDLFHGALLNAGSDPIGDIGHPLPSRELFLRFQNATRLVYVTGEQDPGNLSTDADSIDSMRQWCIFDVDAQITPPVGRQTAGHDIAGPAALSRALRALFNPVTGDPDKMAACRSAIEERLAEKFRQVESLMASGRHDDAQKLLLEIDARYGGLAAPRSIDLAQELSPQS